MTEAVQSQRHDRNALILYGSETGNSQDVAEQLGRIAERLHFNTRVCEMDQVDIVCVDVYKCHSLINLCSVLTQIVTEIAVETHFCHFCRINNGSRRVPDKCEEVMEEPAQEAIASWMSWSRAAHHIWSRR